MLNSLLSNIVFPAKGWGWFSWIQEIVYGMLSWIDSWGWVGYGVAIIFFTFFIKMIMLPLDFLNRYFTKKNQLMMKKLAPEEAALKQQYGNDPMQMQRERQKLYREKGGGQAGFCLVMFLNLFLTLVVFISVFNGLRAISAESINAQAHQLRDVYRAYSEGGEHYVDDELLAEKLNEKYNETTVSFLWIKSIWRPDSWSSQTLSADQYANEMKQSRIPKAEQISKADYEKIFKHITPVKSGWNGLLLLVLLAGLATYGSTALTMYLNNKNLPKKPEGGAGTKIEPIISYSLRDAKNQTQNANTPQIDPAQMGKMMQYIMPIVMVIVSISITSAMTIYIIASSVIGLGTNLGLGFVVDKMLKNKEEKAEKDKPDPNLINPHAKYFKGGK